MDEKASNDFADVWPSFGTVAADCEFCGRTHFATGVGSFIEEDEQEELRAKAKAEPDKYIEDGVSGGVSILIINNKQYVYGCPCQALVNYENFIWHNRERIARYLKQRTEREFAAQQKTRELIASL